MPDIFDASKDKPKSPKKKSHSVVTIAKTVKKQYPKAGALAAFISDPSHLRFKTQQSQEKIILLTRRHPITNIPWIATAILMSLAPLVILPFLDLNSIPPGFRFMAVLVWYLITFAIAFERFLSWYYNVGIVTDERIVDIDFPSLLYRDISETKTDQVQDTSVKVGGYIRSLFDFGDVYVQTAGEKPEIQFQDVPHPTDVSEIVNEQLIQEEQEKIEGRVR